MEDIKPNAERYCLNCGAKTDGHNFCPHCGQSATVDRLTTRNFLISIFAGLTRINRGFLYTCWQLLYRPWRVIADYIRGRRVRYSGPVQILLLLCFFLYVLFPAIGIYDILPLKQSIVPFDDTTELGHFANRVVKFMIDSPSLAYILLFVPAIPAMRIVYRSAGAQRYNTAEFLLAAIYMSDAMLVVECISTLLDTITLGYADTIGNFYILVIGIISVYRAFPGRKMSVGKRVLKLLLFALLAFVLYIIAAILLAGIVIIPRL